MLVFKEHRTWVIYNLDEGENRQISDQVGCIAHRSVVETPMGTFFLTADQGVYLTNGTTMKEVSRQVRPLLQGTDATLSRTAKLNTLTEAAAGYFNGHYYLSYKAQDGTWKTLDYDMVLQSWWLHDLAGNQWVLTDWESEEYSLYTIPTKAKTGVVKAFVKGVYTDSGSVYTGARGLSCFWLSSWEPFWQYFMRHRFAQPQVKKRIHQLFVDGAGELVVNVFRKFGNEAEELKGTVDNEDMATPKSPLTLTAGEFPYKAARFYSLGVSRVWSFMFGNKSGEPLEIDAYACDLSFRKS